MSCNSGDPKLDAAVNTWLKIDKNPVTRQEVLDDIAGAEWDVLKKTMLGRQKFGTAGLRGRMGAGYKCMNDVVILQTAQGLCSYIQKECCQSKLQSGIVVGFDGRYNSKRWAELTAKVFISANIPVYLFTKVCPTPFVSFGTILYEAAAGVMVTASHNPKEDNGYKVYWTNGTQIISPHDDNILDEILQCLDIPDDHWNTEEIRTHPLVKDCQDEVTAQYMKYIRESLPQNVLEDNKNAGIQAVYSAMHGVGYNYVVEAFKVANLKAPISVKEQQDPNPDFPTVKFPNPEEVECVELSQKLAEKTGTKLVLINDPDADRLAVAEYDDSSKSWKVFSGNEMGALFGWWLLQQHVASGSKQEVFVLASIVSSKMLQAIVKGKGHFVETLTGFKWMGNATVILAKEGKMPLFAFEEAIGYMCSHKVPDKDGVSACVQVASLASSLYSKGSSLQKQLQALYSEYGYHVSHNSYYICNEPAIIQKIFRRIRNYHGPGVYPKKVASSDIVYMRDFTAGVKIPEKDSGDGHLQVLGTGLDQEYTSGEMIMFRCSSGLSVTVRTSGTEPKLKYYTELVARATTAQEQEEMKTKLESMVKEFVEELLQPKENGLI
ncbi:glucose 1,6-bisphosphate synthase [Pectinophora gossypiella]|uniref:glucose 1,6-bisphosphate synthase n=1 Tax=Pectinophora gossypiella TaxID=13191 RepID=UPI00214EF4B1|nr:glucose 1,6-bisphosphate synthase [Pectinophora gossypiella]